MTSFSAFKRAANIAAEKSLPLRPNVVGVPSRSVAMYPVIITMVGLRSADYVVALIKES